MNKGTVLTIDDDKDLQQVMEQYLESEGYKVVKASNTKTALETVDTLPLGCILLDLSLPDGEGVNLIPQIKVKSDAAIIVVSGKSETTEKIICLEMGADDYLTKPFEMRELAARIKAVARRMDSHDEPKTTDKAKAQADTIKLEKWILDRAQYQIFNHDGDSLHLTTGEFQLLEALVMAPNRALSREQLFELTRNGEYDIYDRAIDIQIGRIRKKIGDEKGEVIKTVRGVGYMYAGKTEAA